MIFWYINDIRRLAASKVAGRKIPDCVALIVFLDLDSFEEIVCHWYEVGSLWISAAVGAPTNTLYIVRSHERR